jgi:phosphoglucosamine mutase
VTLAFGTDGVRGPADAFTDEWVAALGRAVGRILGPGPFILGRDTRASGPRIAGALATGLASVGCASHDLGVVPTPAVAWVAAAGGNPAAMVSASHNSWTDNGVKVFAAGGVKLGDRQQQELERALAAELAAAAVPGSGNHHGHGATDAVGPDAGDYVDHLVGSVGAGSLAGVTVVLDCGHGAASALAEAVFTRAGASTTVINASPDGHNINQACGSTDLSGLATATRRAGAAVGLAFDGDADRVLAVDEHGATVDGDQIIALLALDRHQRGALRGDAVVVTVMANLGLRLALAAAGVEVIETPVGDRHCLEALEAHGLTLGGEQSGHVIFRDLATTGDGLLTGLQLGELLARRGRPLSELAAAAMTRLPQVLVNVKLPAGTDRDAVLAGIAGPVADAEARLGATGRVLVRASGTEPLVRVMVEATDADHAQAEADRIAAAVDRVASDVARRQSPAV